VSNVQIGRSRSSDRAPEHADRPGAARDRTRSTSPAPSPTWSDVTIVHRTCHDKPENRPVHVSSHHPGVTLRPALLCAPLGAVSPKQRTESLVLNVSKWEHRRLRGICAGLLAYLASASRRHHQESLKRLEYRELRFRRGCDLHEADGQTSVVEERGQGRSAGRAPHERCPSGPARHRPHRWPTHGRPTVITRISHRCHKRSW